MITRLSVNFFFLNITKKCYQRPGIVTHDFNPSTVEAVASIFLLV